MPLGAGNPRLRAPVLIARCVTKAVALRSRLEFEAIVATHDMSAEETVEAANRQASVALVIGPSAKLTRADMVALPPGLRIIANSTVGYDHMDVPAARARGIAVTNTPDVLTACSADMAVMLILCACRRAAEYAGIMRAGWRESYAMPDMLGERASGRTLGIVGMGRIGQAVARRARAFDMKILYHNRQRLPPGLEAGAKYFDSLEAMLPHCEILSLHLPGGDASGVVMTPQAFELLPRGAVFVNTARGSLVDEDAMVDALCSGRLFGAGLDVFRNEPDFDRRLAELPNVFLTPHMASATTATRDAMGFKALDNVMAVLGGNPPLDPVG